jgi:hypothetical protein
MGDFDLQSVDYESQAIGRIIQQYKTAEKFNEVIKLYAGIAQDLEDEWANLYNLLNIDLMGGANLDIIGEIVGQPRVLADADELAFFGFLGAPNALSFGDVFNTLTGGRFRGIDEAVTGDVTLADPEYRLLIKARIIRNYTFCTPEETIAALVFLFGSSAYFKENIMSIDIGVGRELTSTERFLITTYDIIPRASGIGIGNIIEFEDGDDFAFLGGGAKGFSSTTPSSLFVEDANLDYGTSAKTDIGTDDFQLDFDFAVLIYSGTPGDIGVGDFAINDGIGEISVRSSVNLVENRWYNVRCIRQGTELRIRINDEEFQTTASTYTLDIIDIGFQLPDYDSEDISMKNVKLTNLTSATTVLDVGLTEDFTDNSVDPLTPINNNVELQGQDGGNFATIIN